MKAIFLAASLLLLPGCLLVAGPGIVYSTGEDTAEVRIEVNGAAAFAASREEIILRGEIGSADEAAGVIEGRIGASTVKVTVVEEAQGGRSRVTVRARTGDGPGPDQETARQLAVAVVKRTR